MLEGHAERQASMIQLVQSFQEWASEAGAFDANIDWMWYTPLCHRSAEDPRLPVTVACIHIGDEPL